MLGSGSSGNASLVSSGGTTLLVEAGLSGRELVRRIRLAGQRPEDIDAVLISHEHGDHCRGALSFAAPRGAPIACSAGTWRCVRREGRAPTPPWVELRPRAATRIGAVTVTPFATPHDAQESLGFRIESDGAAMVHVTDFGHLDEEIEAAVEGVDLLLIESNYDERSLFDSHYPPRIRQRIASRYGHFSNGALALYLRRRLPRSVRTVVLAHLSENTNTPELALETARQALDAGGRTDVRLLAANRRELTEEVLAVSPSAARRAFRARRFIARSLFDPGAVPVPAKAGRPA